MAYVYPILIKSLTTNLVNILPEAFDVAGGVAAGVAGGVGAGALGAVAVVLDDIYIIIIYKKK